LRRGGIHMKNFFNRMPLTEMEVMYLLGACLVFVLLLIATTLYFQFGWNVLCNFFRLRKKTYTREELKAAGYEPIDNSDLRELLRMATKVTREQQERSSFVGGLNQLKQATKHQKQE
jgi:hypothetical protein